MELRSLLAGLVGGVLYPAWLAAGGLDYLCHRRTDIEHTSGVVESLLHVAQLACMALIVALGALVQITLPTWFLLLGVALLHSALAYVDVSWTQSRRRISPLEQLAHNYLEVLPLVAVALLAVIEWPLQRTPWFASRGDFGWREGLLLGSFALLAGAPVLEELWRTLRARRTDARAVCAQAAMQPHPDGGHAR